MISSVIFVLVVVSLLLIIHLLRGHRQQGGDLDELAGQLRPIDVNAFRNLIDEREEQFLRKRLPTGVFRRIHRERMFAAAEYVRGAARNAAILIRLAEAAKNDPDPAVSAAAEKLLDNALGLRLYAFRVVPRLYISGLVPSISHAPYSVAERYDLASRQMTMLRLLRQPVRVSTSG